MAESGGRLKTFHLFANARVRHTGIGTGNLYYRRQTTKILPDSVLTADLTAEAQRRGGFQRGSLRLRGYTILSRMTQTRRILMWLMLIALAALVSYVGFRGYLTPEMLFNFANSFYC